MRRRHLGSSNPETLGTRLLAWYVAVCTSDCYRECLMIATGNADLQHSHARNSCIEIRESLFQFINKFLIL